MKKYILKKDNYYLSEISFEDGKELTSIVLDKDFRKLYDDFELAEDDRKLIYIETGLDLQVKLFKEEE